ncbi:IclR family transcriptional regulator domain-containing protein [Streptomyces tanashiensis]|uniref:IclR family transcriptional regulator domain-containing protein n=1 Tax=Streptomyces tanashiensis TaxID=67367 RepID=UPI00167B559E|nr:IclR family transcriptional regulator C-terminal domain-containing protein [Streptomyces tanashiensis]
MLYLVRDARCPVTEAEAAATAGVTLRAAAELMVWLSENSLTTALPDGTYTAGPLLEAIGRGENVLQQVLDRLREDTEAAVYVSAYEDGEVSVTHASFANDTPKVDEYVPFKQTAHASAVGQSLLAQLTMEARKEHLSRWRPFSLTSRTVTDQKALFHKIDKHGPTGAHFDVLEYSDSEMCAAISLPMPGQARCVALSLPLAQRHRLTEAANVLSNRSTGLLLALISAVASKEEPDPEQNERTGAKAGTAQSSTGSGSGLLLPPRLHDRLVTPPVFVFIGWG